MFYCIVNSRYSRHLLITSHRYVSGYFDRLRCRVRLTIKITIAKEWQILTDNDWIMALSVCLSLCVCLCLSVSVCLGRGDGGRQPAMSWLIEARLLRVAPTDVHSDDTLHIATSPSTRRQDDGLRHRSRELFFIVTRCVVRQEMGCWCWWFIGYRFTKSNRHGITMF